MRRMKSRARGSSSAIRKRTSHIRIVLSDEIELPQRASVSKAAAKKKAAATKTAAPKAKAKPAKIETEAKAEPASQADEGPGETAAAPKLSSDEDVTKD